MRKQKRSSYQPLIEILEARDVPAFSITQSGNVLNLKGTNAAEQILIEDMGLNTIRVTQNAVESFYDNINRVNVRANGGNDTVSYGVFSPSLKLLIDVDLGTGNDTFNGSLSLLTEMEMNSSSSSPNKLPDADLHRVQVYGRHGNDNITIAAEGQLPFGARLQIVAYGGHGNDNMIASLSGTNDGQTGVILDGESGNDYLAAIVGRGTGPATENNGLLNLVLKGGHGNDNLNSWLGQAAVPGDPDSEGVINNGNMNVTMDGESGNDSVNYYLGTGPAFSTQIVNSGALNVSIKGGHGNDNIVAEVGDSIMDVFNFTNFGTFNLTTEGGAGRDSLRNSVWLNNEDPGVFNGRAVGGLHGDNIYYELLRAGTADFNANARVFAGPLDYVTASAIVQVLNARANRVTYIM